jgi:choline dehydrogenase
VVDDIVIVGGGSAGAVLAARLSEDPGRRVRLVDVGAPYTGPGEADRLANVTFALTTRDWGYSAEVGPGRELDYPQGRAFGGGSSVNAALALRGDPDDYDGWAARGNDLWSWEHLLPCFRRLEADQDHGDAPHHGADGPIPIVRWRADELVPIQQAYRAGCADIGLPWVDDHNAPGSTGVGPLPMNRRDGYRVSTAMAYLGPVLDRPNLTVDAETTVVRVVVEGGRAVGVDVVDGGGARHVPAGEVIVSSGAIGTPALLLRSGIGAADPLRALGIDVRLDLPGVGANLMDHPGVFLLVVPVDGVLDLDRPQFQLGVRTSTTGGTSPNDLLLGLMNFWDLRQSPDFQAMIGAPVVTAFTCGLHQPRSRGAVTLRTADPAVAPHIRLGLLDAGIDVTLLSEALRRLWSLVHTGPVQEVSRSIALLDEATVADDAALAGYLRSMVAPWYHPSGTCAMGPDPAAGAVVDQHLRVHGVAGLRVVDASVFPAIPKAPTNLTTIAVAERAADLIGR